MLGDLGRKGSLKKQCEAEIEEEVMRKGKSTSHRGSTIYKSLGLGRA